MAKNTSLPNIEDGIDNSRPNAPDLSYRNGEWRNKLSAIASDEQGIAVCRSLFKNADDIIKLTAKIREKTDGITPPYDASKLKEEGKAHKSNMPTGAMESVMAKVAPRFHSFVSNLRYLDVAELPPQDPDTGVPIAGHIQKTEKLREIFTRTVREWDKWYLFQVGLAEETTRFGHCFVAWVDDVEWRPTLYRLDQAQVPTGTEIMESDIPFFAAKDNYLVHELFEKIRDKEIAEEEGWEIDNVVEAINKAVPKERPTEGSEGEYIEYEDLVRECVPGWAYAKEARNIEVFHLFAKEYDGTVSQYMYDNRTESLLYSRKSRYAVMSDVVRPFTFQYGNGAIHGSYGVGHMIWDVCTRQEKTRNKVMDSIDDRTKKVLQVASPSDLNKAKLIIRDDSTWIVGATAVGNVGTTPDVVEAAITYDNYLRGLTEEKVGMYTPPPQIKGLERTATEAQISAMREDEQRMAILQYFVKHFSMLTATIRRRIFAPESLDRQANAAYEEALNYCTEREIEIWRNAKARASLSDYSEQRDRETAAYLQTKIGDPDFNQKKIKRIQAGIAIGSSMADEILIAGEDDTVLAEAVRMQTLELLALEKGEMVAVSPRDSHLIHMQVLTGEEDEGGQYGSGAIAALIQQGNMEGAQAALQHWAEHVEAAKASGQLGEMENNAKSFARQMSEAMHGAQQAMQQQQMAQEQLGMEQMAGDVSMSPDVQDVGGGMLRHAGAAQGARAIPSGMI